MFKQIAVLGAGTMGSGLAQLFAGSGIAVSLYDPNGQALQKASETIARSVELHSREGATWGLQKYPEAASKAGFTFGGLDQAPSRLIMTSDMRDAVQGADFVLEAGPENLDIKRDIYREIASYLRNDAVVASNTSSLPLAELAQGQPFADRFVIAHFFNPALLVPLVEIVQLPGTQPEIVDRVMETLVHCGKAPVLLKKDCPGFIANRLQAAVMREACRLLVNGVADAEQIDRAVKEGPGLRWALNGPFEIADFGGLDIWERVTDNLFPTLDSGLTAPEPVRDNVRDGKLGLKTGDGFYRYGDMHEREAVIEERDRSFMRLIQLKRELKNR